MPAQTSFTSSLSIKNFLFGVFITTSLIWSIGCNKDTIELSYTEISLPDNSRFEAVHFINDSIGHIVGGDPFSLAVHWSTYDAGQTWEVDSFSTSITYDIHYTQSGVGYQTGFSGVFKKFGREEAWFISAIPQINFSIPPLNAIDINANDKILVAGGIGFQNGIIIALDENGGYLALDTFPNELSDVAYLDPQTAVAVGYGIIIRSTDGGLTWQQLPVYGDFFRAVHFPTSTTGYIVGSSGSILKSTDAGLTWNHLRNGNRLTTSTKPFRSVFFYTEQAGFAVGDHGLCWTTTDGGENWQPITNLPDRNFYNVFLQNNIGYLVGTKGTLIKFQLP